MKKLGYLLVGLSLMSIGCAEQPGKKKEDKPVAKDGKDAKKADAKGDAKKDEKKADAKAH